MRRLKGLQRLALCAALAVFAFAAAPAGAVTTDTTFGHCIGADTSGGGGKDCVAALGHISASVVGTLSINEMRAVSFGNFSVTCGGGNCTGGAAIYLDPMGVRYAVAGGGDSITLLHGINNGGTAGDATHGDTGSQSPGHYTVSASDEDPADVTQVYISFADTNGNVIDACSPSESVGGPYGGTYFSSATGGYHGTCDNYHPGNFVQLTGPVANAFTVDQFVFNESGSDVYGHYIDNAAAVGPGSTTPFLPGSGANTGHDNGTGTPGGAGALQAIDVVVGATLHTAATAQPTPGRYTGQFIIMVSY